MVALIFSFVQCALIVPLEMIDDLVFQNKGFQPTGMFTALGFVIIYVIIFCFCALAPKFGMNGKKWKSLIGRLNVKQSETDYSKEVSAALASQAVGRFLKESDNDTAKNIGSAMQVAGAVSTVSTSIDMLSEAGSNAENMAHAYRIPIPDIKKQLIAFAVIPILIVVGTYIPQYIKGKQAMDQRIAASAKQVEIVKKALEPVCVRVHADNPNESRSRSSYTVMGYLRDSGATDCYVHVQVNNSGTIINRDIPTDKRLDILNALERIGFFPAYGGVKTMQQIMEKSVPGSGPQFYFVFRENELIGYNFLIGDTKKYKAFPWLAISNMDEQKLAVCEELMKIQIAFFEELGMQKIADHCVRIMEDYRKGIGKRKESDCR